MFSTSVTSSAMSRAQTLSLQHTSLPLVRQFAAPKILPDKVLSQAFTQGRMASPLISNRLSEIGASISSRAQSRLSVITRAHQGPEESPAFDPLSSGDESQGDEEPVSISDDELLAMLLQHKAAKASPANNALLRQLNQVNDKYLFFQKLGVEPEENCDELSDDDAEQLCSFSKNTAQLAWNEYQNFHLKEIERLQGVDRLQIAAELGRVLKSGAVDSGQAAKLVYVFNLLTERLTQLHGVDVKPFYEARKLAEQQAFSADHGASSEPVVPADLEHKAKLLLLDKLPIPIGQLGELIELYAGFEKIFTAAGGQLEPGANVQFTSGLKVKQGSAQISNVKFADVAGIDEAKAELMEVVDFLKNPQKFQAMGARIPRGVLLEGGPGVGKTLLAKAVAGEAGVPFFSVAGSEFVEEYVGVGAKRVRELFEQARQQGTCIIFIDEIDAVGRARANAQSAGGHEHEQTLNQMLVEMDGFGRDTNVIVIAATNRADLLDSALTRPGRFDRTVEVPLPAVDGREAILKVHVKKIKIADDVDLRAIAKLTGGFSGAELENLVNEAALVAIRLGHSEVTAKDFELARDRQIMGIEMPGYQLSEKDKLLTAYHEVGHAIVSHYMPGGNELHKVTIMPRGNSLGSTHYMPEAENGSVSRKQLFARLASLLAGRMAEAEIFGEDEVTTGASSDLYRATNLARRMVTEWGFSPKVGRLNLQYNGHVNPMSAKSADLIDAEISRLLTEAETAARDIMTRHRDEMDTMAQVLVEKETIDADDVKAIFTGVRGQ